MTAANCRIIISGGDARQTGRPESRIYSEKLQALGINAEHILEESHSLNTWQNAQNTSAIPEAMAADRLVLVTSGVHLQRSLQYFRHFGLSHLTAVRSDWINARTGLLPLWFNFAVMDIALHEWTGYFRYQIYQFLGLNPARKHAGDA